MEFPEEPAGYGFPDPLAPLAELLRWLVSTTLHLGVGIAIGLLAVGLMRRRHLRWTWALVALPPALLARPVLAGWSTTLASAALWAAVRGRGAHLRDIHAGADLAAIAAARHGLWQTLVELARRLRVPGGGECSRPAVREERVALGRTEDGELVTMPFGGAKGGRHGLVVGATGSGKTYTLSWILAQAVQSGMGAVVVDPKGDDRLRVELARAAQAAGRRHIEWTPRGPYVYNPFAHGSASSIADKALSGEHFSESHYQRQAQRYLGHAVRALQSAGRHVSLHTLVEQLDPARLEKLVRALPEQEAGATHRYLDSLTPRQRTDLAGVRDRLAILAESDLAPWLDPARPGVESFDLLGAVRERAVVRFSLESDSWPMLAQMLGAGIVGDLQTVISTLQAEPHPTVVAIDEFSAIAAEHVVRLFGRARSAGVSLLLGTQELSDLRLHRREQLLEQVLGNLAVLLAHRQVVPESSELIAALAGTRGEWKGSQSSSGRWTRTRTNAPLLEVEQIRSLPPGWAAVIEPGGEEPHMARVFSVGMTSDSSIR
jgi:type IV secretory pathway TraG/TraD family ATPase VirD4